MAMPPIPVADRLDARQCRTTGGERAHTQEQQPDDPKVGDRGFDLVLRALGHDLLAGHDLEDAPPDHAQDADHEEIGRDRERGAGLAHTAQIQQHDEDDDRDRRHDGVLAHPREQRRRREVVHSR
jgi:hypothetical protein